MRRPLRPAGRPALVRLLAGVERDRDELHQSAAARPADRAASACREVAFDPNHSAEMGFLAPEARKSRGFLPGNVPDGPQLNPLLGFALRSHYLPVVRCLAAGV
jgi:hypothetical protein